MSQGWRRQNSKQKSATLKVLAKIPHQQQEMRRVSFQQQPVERHATQASSGLVAPFQDEGGVEAYVQLVEALQPPTQARFVLTEAVEMQLLRSVYGLQTHTTNVDA